MSRFQPSQTSFSNWRRARRRRHAWRATRRKIGSGGKIFSLTGWKVGWACAAPPIAAAIAKAHSFLTFTTSPNLQRAAGRLAEAEAVYRKVWQNGREGKYGALAQYGLANFNHAGLNVRNAEIYQWNIGVQHQFGNSFLIEANYSANRSTHLPWDKSLRSQDFVSATNRVSPITKIPSSSLP